ncbi:hypothetical protein EJ08DRAFT_23026 [Tothia fuscella]|uniref:Uncharacterized protein n=1 Tax=Tothia fuscella TaxID=1048955 RepID=A0A9P4U1Q6_9PEZI|nr:hypothetical protein EJ08DRAFT_23026 [Tothia fuscella]
MLIHEPRRASKRMATVHSFHSRSIYFHGRFWDTVPFTLGVSTIGVAMAAPAIHNARKKREIIECHLQKLGTTHNTRKGDVLTPMAISGTIGVVTLGVGSMGADAIGQAGVEHGVTMVVENELAVKAGTHFALDAAAMGVEHAHTQHKKATEAFYAPPSALPQQATYAQQGYIPQTQQAPIYMVPWQGGQQWSGYTCQPPQQVNLEEKQYGATMASGFLKLLS